MSVILVIDEHSVYRSGIRELIEARIQRTQVVECSELELLAQSQYADLVLIDSGSLSYHLLDLLQEAHELNPTTRFAVMSASNTRADVLNCLSAGFHGFVYKLQSDEEFLGAIKDLLSGRIFVPGWIADGDGDAPELPPSVNTRMQMPKLTPRQKEILPMIAQGMSTRKLRCTWVSPKGQPKFTWLRCCVPSALETARKRRSSAREIGRVDGSR